MGLGHRYLRLQGRAWERRSWCVSHVCLMLTCNTVRLHIQIKNCNVLLESVEQNQCSYTDSLPLKYVCVLMCGCRPVEMNANHYEFKNFTLTRGLEKWVSSELEFLCTSAQPGKLRCGLSSGWVCCSVYSCSWTRISVLQFRVRETKSSEQDFQWNPPLPGEQGWGLGSGGGCRSEHIWSWTSTVLCFGIRLRTFRDGTALESCPVQRPDGALWSLRADIAENHVTGKMFPYVDALL